MGDDVVLPKVSASPLLEKDGWIMEEGRDNLGCHEVSGGGRVVGAEGEEGLLAGL